jgi:hypothetical protein
MGHTEKVKINLGSKGLPIKYTKPKTGKPCSERLHFTPKAFPQLKELVQSVVWDSVNRTLALRVSESREFDVVRWMQFVDAQHHEIQKSPFVDLDTNQATLAFLDDEGRELAKLVLNNLKVESHHCGLSNIAGGEARPNPLTHSVTVSYQTAELKLTNAAEDGPLGEGKDNEWQTVELPG